MVRFGQAFGSNGGKEFGHEFGEHNGAAQPVFWYNSL